MKKIYSTLLVAAICATAHGQQPNPRLAQLEEFLPTQDIRLDQRQHNFGGEIIRSAGIDIQMSSYWKSYFREGQSEEERQQSILTVNSRIAQKREAMQRLTDYFRATFADLGKEASESYLYEYHKGGIDTIKYSYMNGSREVASFDFDSKPHTGGDYGIADYSDYHLRYSRLYIEPTGIAESDMQPFDADAFTVHIEPALKAFMRLKGAKAVPVRWQHDENFDKEGDFFPTARYAISKRGKNGHPGLTTGTHYIIPAVHEATVKLLYRQLDSLAYDYLCRHPEQQYNYVLTSEMEGSDESRFYEGLPEIVEGRHCKDSDEFFLCCKRETDGNYHILTLRNEGDFWIPVDYASIKSYVGGEKTYIKGMEPKKQTLRK